MVSVFDLLGLGLGLGVMVVNSLAVVTVVRTRSLWTPSHLYICSLAMSDLLLGIFLACTSVRSAASFHNVPLCLALWFCFLLCMWTSVLLSAIIAIDRFVCIAYSYYYERVVSNRKVIVIVVCTWMVSILVSLTMTVLGAASDPASCAARDIFGDAYVHMLSIAVFLLCFSVTGVMYWRISRLALRQLKMVACRRVVVQAEIQPLRESFRQKMRAVKLFLVVFLVFVGCWLPHNVSQLVQTFTEIPFRLKMALAVPGMLNSLCNFFTYLGIKKDFRTALKRLCEIRR